MKIYAKNSFDRLGDDLTELILQYLTFEDKVRLECVSKQWRRLVFNKQFVIEIPREYVTRHSLRSLLRKTDVSELSLNRKALESVLNKCPNITTIRINFEVDSEVLSLIGRYCHRIKSLSYRGNYYRKPSDDKVLSFFRMYGHKLEELHLPGIYEDMHYYLKFCPNVRKVSVDYFLDELTENKEFLPKLERIDSPLIFMPYHYNNVNIEEVVEYVNKMKLLSDKYSQTMKKLNIHVDKLTFKELKTCFNCISRFENLRELYLIISPHEMDKPIDDCLSLIGRKCTKILIFQLCIGPFVMITDRFFTSLSEFKATKKMNLKLLNTTVVKASVECFKHCKQLKQLNIHYPELREDFFANIASFVPKLQSLEISTDKQYSDSFIDSFHSMINIRKVFLFRCYEPIPKMYWYFGKCLSEVMLSPNGMNVKHITHNCGLITDN